MGTGVAPSLMRAPTSKASLLLPITARSFSMRLANFPCRYRQKLLRVLEDKAVRLLALPTETVNVRIIAATNRDLRRAVSAGQFREDLFYRLNVVDIHLPPADDSRICRC